MMGKKIACMEKMNEIAKKSMFAGTVRSNVKMGNVFQNIFGVIPTLIVLIKVMNRIVLVVKVQNVRQINFNVIQRIVWIIRWFVIIIMIVGMGLMNITVNTEHAIFENLGKFFDMLEKSSSLLRAIQEPKVVSLSLKFCYPHCPRESLTP